MRLRRPPAWWRATTALATALAGLLTLSSSLSPNVPWREQALEGFEPGAVSAVAHVAGVLGGLALLGLSWGVLQGRRRAGRAAVVVLGVLGVVHAAKGLDYEEAAIAAGLAVVLAAGMRAAARGAAPSRLAVAAMLLLLAAAGAYAITVTALLVAGHPLGLGAALVRAAGAVLNGPRAGWARTAVHVCLGLALAGVVVALRALLAPARPRDGHDPEEHARAAAIVAAHGRDSLAPFVLRADKAFFFADGGVLAYRTLRETAVVSGDPVGPSGAAPAILARFLAFAERRGWDVVVMSARDEHLDDYRALGLRSLRIGSEAVVDPRTFKLAGRRSRTVRKAVHRVERHGWTVEVLTGAELGAETVAEIASVEAAWRRRHPRLYGFAMASDRLWGAPEDVRDLYVLARNPAGEVRAFQRYLPYREGLSLDAMRRLDDEPNGISDALVVAALEHARGLGCREVSLNFSSFAHLLAAETLERRSQRLACWALRRLQGRFQLDRLLRFASKFGPVERPRHLVYTRRTRLPLAALRVMQAEAYVKSPRLLPRPNAWQPPRAPAGAPPARAPGLAL